jgi:hypothetical protein
MFYFIFYSLSLAGANGYSGINGLGFNRFGGGNVDGLYGNGYQTGYY